LKERWFYNTVCCTFISIATDISLLQNFQANARPGTQDPIQWVLGALSPSVKQVEYEAVTPPYAIMACTGTSALYITP
jgi:hypothetical protein